MISLCDSCFTPLFGRKEGSGIHPFATIIQIHRQFERLLPLSTNSSVPQNPHKKNDILSN